MSVSEPVEVMKLQKYSKLFKKYQEKNIVFHDAFLTQPGDEDGLFHFILNSRIVKSKDTSLQVIVWSIVKVLADQ